MRLRRSRPPQLEREQLMDDPKKEVYGPGGICETCGHFAGRHDEEGCRGMKDDYDCHCAPKKRDCKVFRWVGQDWPRPWLPAPEGLMKGEANANAR